MGRRETRDVVVRAFGLAASLVLAAGCAASSSDARGGRPSARAAAVDGEAEGVRGADKSVGFVAAAVGAAAAEVARGGCTPDMASIDGRFCIDRYEASLVEVTPTGEEYAFSPFEVVRAHHHVRAISEPDVVPQGYISATQAERACNASGKRLCKAAEWLEACRGPENKRYGYAEEREVGRCNDNGKNPVVALFGFRYDASTMNQPALNQLAGTLAKTGDRRGCSNGYGVYDMVGNLHEWVSDRNGTFYGGYYQDVASAGHGEGCGYKTTAHEARYHDYSTGFRCCADVAGAQPVASASPDGAPSGTKASAAKRLKGKGKGNKAGKGKVVAPRPSSKRGGKRR
ncbi:MAG: SUMF1/EgtB/PvdO family nonheme iron enzyme [Labilithrix sp.]|nr:SUMF1/EgtB/PvdO family nonheme iron enzyme [Labilithrix sp.]MCW5833505.1 SUMF1/EgtB/PvdO family nonheme iron enzyme [Labilithrix sp.]